MKLNIFKDEKPSQAFIALLQDLSIYNRYTSFEDLCEKSDISFSKKELKKIITLAETYCIQILSIIAVAQFRKMELSNEWGSAGEEQVRASFLRCLLNILPEESVEYEQYNQFNTVIQEKYNEMQLMHQSVENLKFIINNFFIRLFDKDYRASNWHELTRVLQFLGSKKGFLCTAFGQDFQFIFGDIQVKQIGLHKVTYFVNEDVRSPSIIVPKVALSQDAEVFIRYEAMYCVFHQKWVPVLDSKDSWWLFMPERNISEGIKRKVLHAYGVETVEQTKAIAKDFVKNMCETIVYHELGHIVSRHDILNEEIAAITEGTQIFSYSITMSLFELLADFAPAFKKIKGPLQNMVDVSKKDLKRAEAMFYMYLSDVWFYDTDDQYMYIYSDLMVLAMLRYINDDQSINFKKLEHDIYFKPKESDQLKDQTRFVNYLYDQLTQTVNRLTDYVKKAEFELDGKTLTFDQLKAMIEFQFVVNNSKHEPGEYFYVSSLWSFIFSSVQKLSKADKGVKTLLEAEKNAVINKMYKASASKEEKTKFGTDYRGYIFNRMKDVGIIAINENAE